MANEASKTPAVQVELDINGEKIELNKFVTEFIYQTVTGMAKALRGVGDIETLNLKISKKA